jgi:aryl-alcohol dehydrogenase-like predicted oxidoreductase
VEYRNLGNSGLQVSVVGLGCNNFGMRLDAAGTRTVVDKCIDMGITFFDTADIYGGRGKSEEFLAPALKPHRRNISIATKSSGPMGEGPYWRGASRRYLMDAVDDCLRRLDTDYIDLYQVHFPDPSTPIEETMRALDDIVKSGKVRYVGCSNFTAWQAVEAQWVAKSEHLTPFASAQNQYNLLERNIERELVPAAKKYGMSVLPYFPLASGFLTGKYRPGEPAPEGTRLAGMGANAARILNEKNYDTLMKLEGIALRSGHTMVDLAIGWLVSQDHVGSVIAGATKPEQVEENVRAGEYRLDAGELREVDEILGVGQQGRR